MNRGPTELGRLPQPPTAQASQSTAVTIASQLQEPIPELHDAAPISRATATVAVATTTTPGAHARGPFLRGAWITLGFALTALGGLGILLPGLPSTMFFVGAAACFSRSSTRFERWLLSIPVVGTLVDDYREGRGMPVGSKAITVFLITAFSTLGVMRVDAVALKWAIGVAGAMGVIAVTFYVPTRRNP